MNAQASNQISNSLASAENLIQALYIVLAQSCDQESKFAETIVEKLHGDLQTARAAFQTIAPGFVQ